MRQKYRPVMLSEEALSQEADLVSPLIEEVQSAYGKQLLDKANFVCAYILSFLLIRHRKKLFVGLRTLPPERRHLEGHKVWKHLPLLSQIFEDTFPKQAKTFLQYSPLEVFLSHRIRQCPERIQNFIDSFLEWDNLDIYYRPLSASEVFELQRQGRRCLTFITNRSELTQYILGKRDPLSFLLHDLCHAFKFFSDQALYVQQIKFFQSFHNYLQKYPEFQKQILLSSTLKTEFEYIISDMNSHPSHLWLSYKRSLKKSSELWSSALSQNEFQRLDRLYEFS